MKFILIVDQYFTNRDEYRSGIDFFKKNRQTLFVWDLSKILQSGSIDIIKNNAGVFEAKYLKRFSSIRSVTDSIRKLEKNYFFITSIAYTYKTMRIFKEISSCGFDYGCHGCYAINLFPDVQNSHLLNNPSKLKKLNQYFQKLLRVGLKIPIQFLGIKHSKFFALAGGEKSKAIGPLVGRRTKILKIHASDYDFHLRDENSNQDIEKDHIVYIDQAIYGAPDMYARGEKFDIDIDKYFSDLRNFFDKIEDELKMDVVIASAPKINYSGKEYLFGKRKIVQGFNSRSIIASSSLVLIHYSTAINFAVIYKKPMMFITSDIINKYKKPVIDSLSKYFFSKPININQNINDLHIPEVNKNIYKKYFNDYIKGSSSSNKLFWEQVIELINQ
tara:strand:- start:219 stop:1379 length:1161 start_codon:yes stop_codon:yes gene_type:complete